MSEMITKKHALVAQSGDTLDRLLDDIENFVANNRLTLGGKILYKESDIEYAKARWMYMYGKTVISCRMNSGMPATYASIRIIPILNVE